MYRPESRPPLMRYTGMVWMMHALEIETKRLEMAARKLGDLDEEEPEDDGFLEALDSSATDDWGNDESLKEGAENEEETSNI
ncbi:MAG: hypothetical protein V8R61_01705 [Enterocloster sp.]